MDEASLIQVRSLWPDVADPFARVVPDGCFLVRTLDDWRDAAALRRRELALARYDHSPPLDALLEEACEDAERRGWSPVDDAASGLEKTYELEGVLLALDVSRARTLASEVEVLTARFDQPWPEDAAAPVETSELFQNLVRKILRAGGAPAGLLKEVTLDLLDLTRADVVRESVELPRAPEIVTNAGRFGFALDPPSGLWRARSIEKAYEIVASLEERDTSVVIEMVKRRLPS